MGTGGEGRGGGAELGRGVEHQDAVAGADEPADVGRGIGFRPQGGVEHHDVHVPGRGFQQRADTAGHRR